MARSNAGVPARLDGKTVVITGGARGIGFTTARTLTGLGARVAIGDIDESRLKEAAAELGLDVYAPVDVSDVASFEAFLDECERQLGRIDVLINNAGIMPVGRLADEPDRVSRRIIDINVMGVINGTKLALHRMLPARSGHIINIASLAGETYTPGLATYTASKYAVVGFTDAVRVENRGSGVEFSSVLPTFTNTELVAGTKGVKGVRNAEPQEIADAIVSLIHKPRPKVRVTKMAGAIIASQRLMTQRTAEAIGRKLGADRVFLDDVDVEARKAYEDRVRGV